MKLLSATLTLLLILTSCYLQAAMAGSALCESKCKVRCAKAGVMDRCLRHCGVLRGVQVCAFGDLRERG
ncbi:Gibberellin regulated protein [Musa troglodytarum]|uniref:Gibberellin regulated protein n=1 Tax=Musa troglodytarum TaxID=320322 RepID=A0A9E7G460_9LILI|nr:Gibberellin regulated protein [Musa troglodytarum]